MSVIGLLLALTLTFAHPSPARAQLPGALLMVNVSNELVRAHLSLTRIGVAEVGDKYTVAGTVVGLGKKMPDKVVLRIVTSNGQRLTRSSRLQSTPIGSYGFLVWVPKDEGALKIVTISLK